MQIKFSLEEIIPSQCQLGEGIYLSKDCAAWVDIEKNNIFYISNNKLKEFGFKSKPSVILGFQDKNILVGTDIGIVKLNIENGSECLLRNNGMKHNQKIYRSNDGGYFCKYYYLGFMHKSNPQLNDGYIYKIKDGNFYLVEDEIFIPNTFIKLGNQLLVSDSLKSIIWKYDIDVNGDFKNKNIWAQLDEKIAPDGGCVVQDLIFIALWDDASVAIFNTDGKIITKIPLPALRPTNCKFRMETSQLWITSAREGLSEAQLLAYPESGNTLIYNIKIC